MLAIIPIVGLEVFRSQQSVDQSLDDLRGRADQMVDTANEQYDDMMLQGQVVLDFFAAAPESSGTVDQCGAFADTIKSRYSWIAGIGTISAKGDALCGEAARKHINLFEKPYFQQALATKSLTVSDFHIGQISHKPIVSMLKPILDDHGTVMRVVVMGIDLKAFNSLIAEKKLADDTCITVFDSAGTVVARYPESEKYIGQDMSSHPLFQAMKANRKGEFEGLGLDQIKRLYAYRPFWNSSSYIAVGVLEQPVMDSIHHRLIENLIIVLITIAAVALTGAIATQILIFGPTRRLTTAAMVIGEGKFETLPALHASMPEMSEMLSAFQDMAVNLQSREQTLTRSESETRAINRNLLLGEQIANAGYWRVDFPGDRVTWSDGTYRIFGVSPHDFFPNLESGINFYHPDDRKAVKEAIEMAVSLHRDFEYTLRIIRADGELRYIQSRGFCELGASGTVQSIFGAIIDVTVQKETEARLQAARQAAEAASRSKSNFLSSMSHELRTPLTSIIGFADLLLMRTRTPELRHYLKLQREAGQHLLTLISDILDHSKIEAGKMQLESIPFNIRELLDNCVGVMKNEADRRSISLETITSIAIPPTLMGDPNRLKQILLNLIGNAIKFTDTGGVTVEVEPTGVAGDVMALRFSVRDTGKGIAHDHIDKLFKRFSQADISTTRHFGGTGLGLAISKELVQAMGGTIGVDSELGKGSIFWFTLRMLTGEAKKSVVEISTPKTMAKSRILLAEDSQVNQLLFVELLQTLGHDVTAVNNGAEAVTAVRTGDKYDLVLMDVQMPVMDGLAATGVLRGDNYTLPIIGITANAMQEDIERCAAAGMSGHLSKPVDIEELVQAIERVMADKPVG